MAAPAWVKQVEVTGGNARQPAPVSLLTSGEKSVAHDDWVVIIQGGQFGSQGVPRVHYRRELGVAWQPGHRSGKP